MYAILVKMTNIAYICILTLNHQHMKLSDLSGLGNYHTKKLGLIVASVYLILEVILKIRGVADEQLLKMVHLFFLLSLFWAVFSKEKRDDERLQAIRYFTFKITLQLFVMAAAIDLIRGYGIAPIYFATGSLTVYLIIYYFCIIVDPKFIYRERTRENHGPWVMALTAIIFIAVAIRIFNEINTL